MALSVRKGGSRHTGQAAPPQRNIHGCLIGSLAIAKIEWSNWIKFMWKFLGVLMIGAIITVLIAVGIGF